MTLTQLFQIIGLAIIGVGFEVLTFLIFAIYDEPKHPESNFIACPNCGTIIYK